MSVDITKIVWNRQLPMLSFHSGRKEDALVISAETPRGMAYAFVFYAGMGKQNGRPAQVWTMWTFNGYVIKGHAFDEWTYRYDVPDDLDRAIADWLRWLEYNTNA